MGVLLDSWVLDTLVEPLGPVDVGTVVDISVGVDEVPVTPLFPVTEVPKVGPLVREVLP